MKCTNLLTINKDIKNHRDVPMHILSCTDVFSTISTVGSKGYNTMIVGVWTGCTIGRNGPAVHWIW